MRRAGSLAVGSRKCFMVMEVAHTGCTPELRQFRVEAVASGVLRPCTQSDPEAQGVRNCMYRKEIFMGN